MSDPVIRVENLSKRYLIGQGGAKGGSYSTFRESIVSGVKAIAGKVTKKTSQANSTEEFWALKDVSFEINRGDVVGIIGRNGAGKSTLLKVLSRITEPTDGKITMDGRIASLLEVGTGFHPELTGRENVYLNGSILGMSRAEVKRKFDEIVAFSEVEKFLDTPVKRYSSGMYTRLAFAVAAHLECEILVVDEVLAVGDSEFQKKCLGKMGEVAASGRTVLFVSHNLGMMGHICHTGLYLQKGKLVEHGEISKILSDYLQTADRNQLYRPARKGKPTITSVAVDAAALAKSEFRVTVGFESELQFDPVVGMVISGSGTPIFGSNKLIHPNSKLNNFSCRCGEATLRVTDLPLHSGTYQISLWLTDSKGNVLDHLPDAICFDYASPLPISTHFSTSVIGFVRVNASWDYSSANNESQLTDN